ncbi:MAG: hypothetical protein ACPL0B_00935 [Anaerolineales bacterium]
MSRFSRLVFWSTILLVFIMAARISIDSDTWWHLRAGQWIFEHHHLPSTDPFSYTRQNAEWKYPGWLVEVPMYWIYFQLGPGGLNLFTAMLVALTFGFVYQTASGNPLLRAFVIILSAIASAVYWSARPHLITLLFTSIMLYLLEFAGRSRDKSTNSWVLIGLPLMMWFWVNSHGGFLVGFIVWGIYLAGEVISTLTSKYIHWVAEKGCAEIGEGESRSTSNNSIKWFLEVGTGMFLLSLINPLGIKIYFYPFQTVAIKSLQNYIQEWQTPNFHWISTQPFIWVTILLFAALGFSNKKIKITDFFIISIFFYLALIAGRNLALFAVVTPPIILKNLNEVGLSRDTFPFFNQQSAKSFSPRTQNWINWGIFGVLLLGALVKVYTVFPAAVNEKAFRSQFPVDIVGHIKKLPVQGELFNSYNWGGYLLWALPERKVFIDGRTDLYNDEIINEWLKVVQFKTGWEDVLKKWNIQLVLMEKDWLGAQLLQLHGWCVIDQDELAVLLQRCQ